MALRNVLTDGDPALGKVCKRVDVFNQRLADLIDDMFETMAEHNGCGLAANQVGVIKRVFVMEFDEQKYEFVNPEIIDNEGESCDVEGCLSFPGVSGYVCRPETIKIKGQDRKGQWHVHKFEGILARCCCHETDHLNGVVFTSKFVEPPEDGKKQD